MTRHLDVVLMICDECGENVNDLGYLTIDVAEANEQLKYGIRDGQENGSSEKRSDDDNSSDDNSAGDNSSDKDKIDGLDDETDDEIEDELSARRRKIAKRGAQTRWQHIAPIKKTDWRIDHEFCDRRMCISDYRIPAREIMTKNDLILKLANLSESARWFVATDWQKLVRRILNDTDNMVNAHDSEESKVGVS
jgi:hypothetical protein